jgi:hypothetical protein
VWADGGLASQRFSAHIQEMTSDASSSAEIVNGRRILGSPWGWQLEFQRIRMAKFPDKPLTSWQKFDTLELASVPTLTDDSQTSSDLRIWANEENRTNFDWRR